MADFPLPPDPAARYAELEQAYTEDRWADVVRLGEGLVTDLSGSGPISQPELLGRAQLLLGHAHLYGLADPSAAQPHYRDVLAFSTDANLRQLAETALASCGDPPSNAGEPEAPNEPDSFLAVVDAARQTSQSPTTGAAAPWLAEASPQPNLEVEVVEEPELVEVAQADPSLAEELELELSQIRERRQSARQDGAKTTERIAPELGSAAGLTARAQAPETNVQAPGTNIRPFETKTPVAAPKTGPENVAVAGSAASRLDQDEELERCLLRVVLKG